MLSKNKIKLITGLSQKKFRDETGLFVAEGGKLVCDLAVAFHCELLVVCDKKQDEFHAVTADEVIVVSDDELRKISSHKTPQGILALFRKPVYSSEAKPWITKLCLALDDVQDPGNLGTIIRIADWFGIHDIFCSLHSADAFSPKTVQATMGALARVRVHTVDLPEFLQSVSQHVPLYGTFMDGENLYTQNTGTNGMLIMGNEGNGISPAIEKLVSHKLLIPNFPPDSVSSESLNVAVATAIVCSEFRRRQSMPA